VGDAWRRAHLQVEAAFQKETLATKMGQKRVTFSPQGLGIACRPETIPWVKEGRECLLDYFTDAWKIGSLPICATHGQPCSK